jgi:hypothetical protein
MTFTRIATLLFLLVFVGVAVWVTTRTVERSMETQNIEDESPHGTLFARGGLRTNTDIHAVPLDEVLSGTPYRDNIPAINEPSFITIADARDEGLTDEQGVVVTAGNTTRFYPFTILVWHEIVNDVIEDQALAVTFCPLCGSAVVFGARVDGTAENFGVSGKLYESNLLMYDESTHTLWSQILGEALVGEHTGKKLTVYPSQVMPFNEFTERHPKGEVLSKRTGHVRNYDLYPYDDYETSDDTLFPVTVMDARFQAKEMFYIIDVEATSMAFQLAKLRAENGTTLSHNGMELTVMVDGSEVTVTDTNGTIIPGYYAMWFSWATHHQDGGVVWPAQ